MNIKKLDDKPMVIHTKEEVKIHSHKPKGASIKGSEIYTVNRNPTVKRSNNYEKRGIRLYQRNKRRYNYTEYRTKIRGRINVSNQSIKCKQKSLRNMSLIGAKVASDQIEGGKEVQQASGVLYGVAKPVTGISSKGASVLKEQALKDRKRKLKPVQSGENISKKDIKKSGAGGTAKTTRKSSHVAGGTLGGSGYKANGQTNRKRKFFLDKVRAKDVKQETFMTDMKKLVFGKVSMVMKKVLVSIAPALLLVTLLIALICVPVIAVVASIYNSPFALFLPPLEAGDTVSTVTSSYVSEFYREVNKLANEHTGYDGGEIVYVDYEGTDAKPSNYYDIMCVYMVKHGVEETATIMNDTAKEWLEEIVDDMCSYTTSTRTENYENEDGTTGSKTILSVNISLKNYQDMISIYGFSTEKISLLNEMMSSENLAMLGYVESSDGNSVSSLTQAEIDTILNAISDSTQKSVLNYALTKVGYPYSQELRDSGNYYDCSSLAYYSWKAAGVDISYGGATTAAAEAKGLNEAGKSVTESELMAGDLIFYSYTNNGRYMNISHVGIYAGNGMMVEAKNKAAGVVYGDFHSGSAVLYARPNK